MGELDIDKLIEQLECLQVIPEKQVQELFEIGRDLLVEESNVQPVSSPVTLVGDIHGQFQDLLYMFRQYGQPPNTNYIFIGDFVDRGYNSVEVLTLLIAYKVKYPGHITLIRGNHECRQITSMYGFYDEVLKKYGNLNVWKYATDLFDYLPLSCIVDNQKLAVHGGLSPQIRTLDQLRQVDRQVETPGTGAMRDLLWSDPEDLPDDQPWKVSPRGAGYLFSQTVTHQFNHINNLDLICRAHQLVQEGYKYWFNDTLVTIWSAPNYCYRCGNVASVLQLNQQERNFQVYQAVNATSQQVANLLTPNNLLPYFL